MPTNPAAVILDKVERSLLSASVQFIGLPRS